MHEFGLILRIADIVTAEAKKKGASKVTGIVITLGRFSGVSEHSLLFAVGSAFSNTMLEGAEVIIEHVEPFAECQNCGKDYNVEGYELKCPECGSTDTVLLKGNEFTIKSFSIK